MTKVTFYDGIFAKGEELIYSVITARFRGKWILVRHTDRVTWEIPGGHIEAGEDPDDTAERELKEETGAKQFLIEFVAGYSVEKEGEMGYGKLYFAEVFELGPVPDTSEIAEISFFNSLPDNLTYPDIQPYLFERVKKFLQEGNIPRQ